MWNVFGRLEVAFTSAFGSSFALFDFTVIAVIIICYGILQQKTQYNIK